MWGWPQSSSTTPSYQVPNQFSTPSFPVSQHNSQTPPILSSQPSFSQLLSKYPTTDYGNNHQRDQMISTYSSPTVTSSSHSTHLPWSGASCYNVTSHPTPISAPPPDSGHTVVGGSDGNRDTHKASSSGSSAISNSCFSMDYILQKPVPTESPNIAPYHESYSYYHQAGSSYNKPPPQHQIHSSSTDTSGMSYFENPKIYHNLGRVPQTHYASSKALPSVGVSSLPTSEEPFSPPELVLKNPGSQTSNESDTRRDQLHDPIVVSKPHFSIDEDASDSPPPVGNRFASGVFELGVPVPPSAGQLSEGDSISTSGSSSKGNREESSSTATSSTSTSSNSSEDSTMDTTRQGHSDHSPVVTPLPPPLVPTCSLHKNEGNEFEGENDDVFLPPSPTPQSISEVKKASSPQAKNMSSQLEGSLVLNDGERKTASVVVGKRGRAAGKVLDEEKLRLPLNNGWQRIVRTRLGENNGPTRVDICYVTPCKRRLRTFPEIQRYLNQNTDCAGLNIDNFSFSKKVNVGVVINEETLMNNATEELSRPRRGRPPKHLKALKEMERNRELGNDTANRSDVRISLEPHEITMSRGPGNPTPFVSYQSNIPSTNSGATHSLHDRFLPVACVPSLVRDVESMSNRTIEEQRGVKRKSSMEEERNLVLKKPRGRPKGSGNRSSTGRKRVPRTVKYIPPSLAPHPEHLGINGDAIDLQQNEGTTLETTRIQKQLEDKEKRRRLLVKAREGSGGMRKKLGSNSLQRSQRKLAQQARRERERQAKHKQTIVLKQKEVEIEEIRKSRLARQKENEYRKQALERTRNLMEQLKKQEEERERLTRLRQLDLEKAEQLRKPTEDLLVKNLSDMPSLSKMELVALSSEAFMDLVTAFQFVHSFEDFLDLDSAPQFIDMYCGLFSTTIDSDDMLVVCSEDTDTILNVLIQMVKAVVHDPGTKTQAVSGSSLRELEVKEHTVSEILRLFLSKVDNETIQKICRHLEHLPFSALCPSYKTRVLSFLTEELLRSSSLCKEIDNRMEQICTLRRIKWKISLKLKRFRSRFNEAFGADTPTKPPLYSGRGRPPKKIALNLPNDVESSDEEEGGGGGEDLSDNESDDYTDEDSDEEPSEDKEELTKRIKDMKKKIVCIRSRISTASKQMRVFPLGQDRYSRQYWSLPQTGGILVEGIETSTFDALEQYISEVTYRREMELRLSRIDTEPPGSSSVLESAKEPATNPSSVQHSDSDAESRNVMMGGVDTPTPSDLTPNPSPPLLNTTAKEGLPTKSITAHPLEMQQLANNKSTLTSEPNNPLSTNSFPSGLQPTIEDATSNHTGTSSISWFSILPRKQCEVLHYLDNQQQQGLLMAPQFLGGGSGGGGGGGGYAYIAPGGGAVLGQPMVQQVQMGYALVGNNLVQVPQTQYVMAAQDQSTPTAVGNNQLIPLGNGQYALAPTTGNNVQYVSINGNQYAIMPAPDQQEGRSNGVEGSHPLIDTAQKSTGNKEGSHSAAAQISFPSAKIPQSLSPTPIQVEEQPQQLLTLAIPSSNGDEPQYVQVPADPRVLSGECSYAALPQPDGTTQIVLVEKNSLGVGSSQTLPSENMSLECPHAVVMDNEYECSPWCVDITLMYADSPLPFTNEGEGPVVRQLVPEIYDENEKKLSQLLEQIDKNLTHGWWSITDTFELERLIRSLTMRGFREKNLHKILSKNRDIICHSMTDPKMNLSESLSQKLQSLVQQSLTTSREQENETAETDKLPVKSEEIPGGSNEMEVESVCHSVSDQEDGDDCQPTKTLALPNDDTVVWDPFFPDRINKGFHKIMEYLEGMETRLFDAHLPLEGSKKIHQEFPVDVGNEVLNLTAIMKFTSLVSHCLLRLEASVQKRYLKWPFREKHADTRKPSPSGSSPTPIEDTPALIKWRSAVSCASSSSQLGVCMNQLERCIAWEKSPMKVFCVICRTGDNESLLLLCDKCDRGTHTYCCKPKLENIPEGNWYCHDCVVNASRKTVCNVCETARGILLHCTECPTVIHKRCHNPPLTRVPNGPWLCSTCRRQNRRSKSGHMKDELVLCYELLKELEEHDDAWPFLQPVDKKKVPGYYKVIKKPMDYSTVKTKLLDGRYSNKEAFAVDIRLVFDNCSFYNEDDSEIGLTGHRMKQFFEKKWAELPW